jgi:protein tyrosine phosphatase/5-hydroxyisourate hydrolase-like protein (transthyretin family)
MAPSSFFIKSFSSSSSCRRLVAFLSLLLLNPLPIIYGAPARTAEKSQTVQQRHKRELLPINDNYATNIANDYIDNGDEYILLPEPEVVYAGLLGCKYDLNVCNANEACFDDGLFGQCWNGKGSERKAFTLKENVDELSGDKLIALEHTFEFLQRYHLDWKDFLTQCILSNILSDHNRLINRHHLENLYANCLNKDQQFDEMIAEQQEQELYRRQFEEQDWMDREKKQLYRDPYLALSKTNNFLANIDNPFNIPLLLRYDTGIHRPRPVSTAVALAEALAEEEQLRMQQLQDSELDYGDDSIDIDDVEIPPQRQQSSQSIEDETIMDEPTKVSFHMNEGHPGLLETLQINNNKQKFPLQSQEAMLRKNLTMTNNKTTSGADAERYFTVETARGYIAIDRDFKDQVEGARLLALIAQMNAWPPSIFTELNTNHRVLTFHVLDNANNINASSVASSALNIQKAIENQLGVHVTDSGIGDPRRGGQLRIERHNGSKLAIITLVTCGMVLFTMGAFALLYFIKRNDRIRNKLAEITHIKGLSTKDYQDLCRQHMHEQPSSSKSPEIHTVHHASASTPVLGSASASGHVKNNSEGSSTRSSTSSWSEEPVAPVNMDIMTGHLILSYMEDHLRNRHRLEAEWQALCADEANEERASCSIALSEANAGKNRYSDCVPYDHARIRLLNTNDDGYINASPISDSDPKCKYIATQGPTPNTTSAFWQMVWEQGSCVIVALTRPIENGITMCHHYWPVEGCERFNDFEVNLVSEHIWSDDYLVRSFYLKNVQTMETRTVTQFHFLTWSELDIPTSAKALLDFRRKVNKCFRGRSSPIIVHCNDGVGRTGSYILLDIVLNRICKGAREINIAATLEHIRDQRAKMVKSKNQFEFTFVAIAEEVTHLLKALPQ